LRLGNHDRSYRYGRGRAEHPEPDREHSDSDEREQRYNRDEKTKPRRPAGCQSLHLHRQLTQTCLNAGQIGPDADSGVAGDGQRERVSGRHSKRGLPQIPLLTALDRDDQSVLTIRQMKADWRRPFAVTAKPVASLAVVAQGKLSDRLPALVSNRRLDPSALACFREGPTIFTNANRDREIR
jgi:hypothetical protein